MSRQAPAKPADGWPAKPAHGLALPRSGLVVRLAILIALFALEKIGLNQFVDFDRAVASQGFGRLVRDAQHLGFRFLVAFAAAIALFAYVRGAAALKPADDAMRATPIRLRWLAGHLAALACLVPLTYLLYRNDQVALPLGAVVAAWLALGAAGAWCALRAFGPWEAWALAGRSLGNSWIYALIAAALSTAALQFTQDHLWEPTAALTFHLVRAVLTPLLPNLQADPATHVLATPMFAIEVSRLCSGLEGIGLILAFTGAWLIHFRHEYFFPRALLLIPIGIAAIFTLNVVRLAVLVLIGNVGLHDVAVYGFHSQAGWIAFIAVACGMAVLSRRSTWLNRTAVHLPRAESSDNPTAVFLMPLIAILAAGMLSHAISGDFEYFYPLRVIAALWVLLRRRARLAAALDWRWSWRGVAVGAAVFLIWIAATHWLVSPAPMPAKLAALPESSRIFWIACRVLGSVALVPIAEELAYRAYLMRRIVSPDFETVPFRAIGIVPLGVTSIVFGLAHGSMWAAGIAAGLAYGVLLIRRERFGEAVAAHLTSNALVAAAVLIGGEWQLW